MSRSGGGVRKITASALKVGKCYLTNTGRVWRVLQRMPDGRVLYEHRADKAAAVSWLPGMLMANALPAEVVIEREVPWDWGAQTQEQGMR